MLEYWILFTPTTLLPSTSGAWLNARMDLLSQGSDAPPDAAGTAAEDGLAVVPAETGERRIFTIATAERNRRLAFREGCTALPYDALADVRTGWLLAVPDGVLLEPDFRRRLAPVSQPVRLCSGTASVVWGPADQVGAWLAAGGAGPLPEQSAREGLLLDVLTPESRRHAVNTLLARSGKPSDGPVARHLNRPISRQFTRLFLWLRLSPNHASVICLLIGIASGWFAAQPDALSLAMAGFLYQFASMFDGVDGEMARMTLRDSPRGAMIDSIIDYFTHAFCFAGLILGWFRSDAGPAEIVALVLLLLTVAVVLFFVGVVVRRHGPPGETMMLTHFSLWVNRAATRPDCPLSLRIANGLFPIVRRDVVALLLMLATFTGRRETLGLLVAGGLAVGAYALIFHRKRIVAEARACEAPAQNIGTQATALGLGGG
jgi:phosphatidylglycerophosphate synthase